MRHALIGKTVDEAVTIVLNNAARLITYDDHKRRKVYGEGEFSVKVKVRGGVIIEVRGDD